MSASYPASAKSFAAIVDGVDYPVATQLNQAYDEITAIEQDLISAGLTTTLVAITTFTPVIGGAGGTSGQTYTTQLGRALKLGRLVHVQINVTLSAKGTITGNVEIQGLPYTALNVTGVFGVLNVQWFGLGATKVAVTAEPSPNTTVAAVYGLGAAGATMLALTTADISDATEFVISGTYLANS